MCAGFGGFDWRAKNLQTTEMPACFDEPESAAIARGELVRLSDKVVPEAGISGAHRDHDAA
jgi:hypothetical protein